MILLKSIWTLPPGRPEGSKADPAIRAMLRVRQPEQLRGFGIGRSEKERVALGAAPEKESGRKGAGHTAH